MIYVVALGIGVIAACIAVFVGWLLAKHTKLSASLVAVIRLSVLLYVWWLLTTMALLTIT